MSRFGDVEQVPVQSPDDPQFRYALIISNPKNKGNWYAQSGETSGEAIRNLYYWVLNCLWLEYLDVESQRSP